MIAITDSPYPKRNILGMPLHWVNKSGVNDFIGTVIERGAQSLVLNLNIHCVCLAQRETWMKAFFQKAGLVFCDGDGVRLGMRLLGYRPPEKMTYDRWIWDLAEFCDKRRYRLYFLGAKPGIAEEAAQKLRSRFPALQICGAHHGYFQVQGPENEALIRQINLLKPHLLILGMGMPLQEAWLRDYGSRLAVNIFLTGGAVFDYASGRAKRSPDWMIRCRLEWLHRILQEPGRLSGRYATEIPYFFYRILKAKLGWDSREAK
ncbi:MAG: WecB/TagA/CpsF family glycosyltransferase [Candidatus Omnitrophica bacterium]|nr:WecB/TagA/CpsF family glycosyltransferase [Candidatus Omnitrophota bacterium]